MPLPTLVRDLLLIEPIYDPDKVGSIWMPPAAQNDAPSQGVVHAVGPEQTEVEVNFRVIVTTSEWVRKPSIYWLQGDTRLYFYSDREVVAFLTDEAEVYPRRDRVILRPSWSPSGVVQHGSLYTPDRIFSAPESPQFGTVLRVGEDVTLVKRGDTVVIPRYGGNEFGVVDRVLYSIKEKDIPGILHAVENDTPKPTRHRAEAAREPR